MKKIKIFLLILTSLLVLGISTTAYATQQSHSYEEVGSYLSSTSSWTTFDATFDLLIPYFFSEQELSAEEKEDGILYNATMFDNGEEACRMTVVKDELDSPMTLQELQTSLSSLRIDSSIETINDIPVIEIYIREESYPIFCAMLYMKDNTLYSVLINVLDSSAADIEILFYSLFETSEETHKELIPGMDDTLSKIVKNFQYITK